MAEFLVESYLSRTAADGHAVERDAKRVRDAADALAREGATVRYLRSMFIPEEETAFYFYEAVSADEVREAARRAAIDVESVVETITELPVVRGRGS